MADQFPGGREKLPHSSSPPPGHYLRQKPIEGPRFVRLILLVCVGVTILAVGLFFLVVRLRELHGLPGLE